MSDATAHEVQPTTAPGPADVRPEDGDARPEPGQVQPGQNPQLLMFRAPSVPPPGPAPGAPPPPHTAGAGPAGEDDDGPVYLEGDEPAPGAAWAVALDDGREYVGPFAAAWEDGAPKVRVWYAAPAKQGGYRTDGYARTFRPEHDVEDLAAALGEGIYIAQIHGAGGAIALRKAIRIGSRRRGPIDEPPAPPRPHRVAAAAAPQVAALEAQLATMRAQLVDAEKRERARSEKELAAMRAELAALRARPAGAPAPVVGLEALEAAVDALVSVDERKAQLRERLAAALGSDEAGGFERALMDGFKMLAGSPEGQDAIADMMKAARG